MSAGHTPGPWRVGKAGPNLCPTVGTQDGLMVAMVAHGENHPTAANARLIAAAPELLAALALANGHLEHMAAWMSRLRTGYSFEALGEDMPSIKAAIARATGAA